MRRSVLPYSRYNGTREEIQITTSPDALRAFLMPCGDLRQPMPCGSAAGLSASQTAPRRATAGTDPRRRCAPDNARAQNALQATQSRFSVYPYKDTTNAGNAGNCPPDAPHSAHRTNATQRDAFPPGLVPEMGIFSWKILDVGKISQFLTTFLLFFTESPVLAAINGQKSKVVKSKVATKKPHEKS